MRQDEWVAEANPAQSPAELKRQAALYALSMLDTDPEEEFDRIARLAQRLLMTTSAVVSFMDHNRQWYKARAGVEAVEAERSDTFCTHVIDDGMPLVVEDATEDARFADNPHVTAPGGVRFYAGVPIHAPGGYAVGTLCVFDPAPRPPSSTDLAPLLDLAAMVDEIIAARVLATVDHLTGVQTRGGFVRAAAPLLRLADRAGMVMTLGFFDVNGLKGINDEFGHDVGDAVIASVGRMLRHCFRSADVIGRLGGDEFAVLFAATDAQGTAKAVDRFQQALADHVDRHLPVKLTVAAGLVGRPPGGAPLDELLGQADALMYGDKRKAVASTD